MIINQIGSTGFQDRNPIFQNNFLMTDLDPGKRKYQSHDIMLMCILCGSINR